MAIAALEDAGLLSWVHRIARIRRRERDLFGHIVTVSEVVRTSNGYCFFDPLDRMRGRIPGKSENRTGTAEPRFNKDGERLDGARVISEGPSQAPAMPSDRSLAPQREHGNSVCAQLSPAERAAIVARMDAGVATRADWAAWTAAL